MLYANIARNLASSAHRSPLMLAGQKLVKGRMNVPFREVTDAVAFTGPVPEVSKMAAPKKDFWATVRRSAWGGKRASKWRRAMGLLKYPYSLVKHAILWILGKRQGFKNRHPFGKESRHQIMDRIEVLNKQINAPDLRFQFSKADIEAADLHKSYLLKTHDSLLGLAQLQNAAGWGATAKALERFLSANGKNNGESCANISATHAAKLSNGAPMKRVKVKQGGASVVGANFGKREHVEKRLAETGPDTVIFPTEAYQTKIDRVAGSEREQLIRDAEQNMVNRFGIDGSIQPVSKPEEIMRQLMARKNGAQALVFDWKKGGQAGYGHVTLLTKIRGELYHIDNLNQKSAVVSRFLDWAVSHQPNRLWYGMLKENVHPTIANA